MITTPINDCQTEYNELCRLGGGPRGGPVRQRVADLLRRAGHELNGWLQADTTAALQRLRDVNPWHLCYAIALVWGRFAKHESDFVDAAARLMSDWNDRLLTEALRHYRELGPDSLEGSLRSGYAAFAEAEGLLPRAIPTDAAALRRVQEGWFGLLLSREHRFAYIGNWNGVALFMVALFAHNSLRGDRNLGGVILPSGGPIIQGLRVLYDDGVVAEAPAGHEAEESLDPAQLFLLQGQMVALARDCRDADPLDMHSGLYQLGTRRND